MPRAQSSSLCLFGMIAAVLHSPLGLQAQTGKGTSPPTLPAFHGYLVNMTKDQIKNVGTLTVEGGKNGSVTTTYQVNEQTVFQFRQGTNVWGANFLKDHLGQKVSVVAIKGSNPLTAATVQIILQPPPPPLPPPPPQPPKIPYYHGQVVKVGTDPATKHTHITIKLHKHVPPPPVVGQITKLGLDKVDGIGSITIKAGGKHHTFYVDANTRFLKIGKKHQHAVTFLSVHDGEQVAIFPSHGHWAWKADIILPGATFVPPPPPKDHFLTFRVNTNTNYVLFHLGIQTPTTLAAVVIGEEIAIQPIGIHSHLAQNVHIHSPRAIHGVLEAVSPQGISVKHKVDGKDTLQVVPLAAATRYELVIGKEVKPASLAKLHKGNHVVVWRLAAPPHVAER